MHVMLNGESTHSLLAAAIMPLYLDCLPRSAMADSSSSFLLHFDKNGSHITCPAIY
jgi:hypothetical protein